MYKKSNANIRLNDKNIKLFSPKIGKIQDIHSHSSYSALYRCPRQYKKVKMFKHRRYKN